MVSTSSANQTTCLFYVSSHEIPIIVLTLLESNKNSALFRLFFNALLYFKEKGIIDYLKSHLVKSSPALSENVKLQS